MRYGHHGRTMRRLVLILTLLAATLGAAPSFAQSRSQLSAALHDRHTTPADQQIEACNKIIALKVFSGEKLATIYFWRAVAWNKKGDYTQVIAAASEAIRLKGDVAIYNFVARPITTRANTTSPFQISTTRSGWARRAASFFITAAMPGVPGAIMRKPSPTTTRRSRPIRRRPTPGKTAAPRSRRSAISTARSPTSTKRSGSIRRCPRRSPTAP